MAFTYAKQLLYQLSHIPSLLQVFNRSNLVSKGTFGDIFGCSTKEKMLAQTINRLRKKLGKQHFSQSLKII